MAIRRETLREVGGWDERLGAGTSFPAAEDNDLGFRLLEAGYRIAYHPEAVAWHRAWRAERDYLPLRWAYGRGQGAYYAKHAALSDAYMVRRFGADLGRLAAGLRAAGLDPAAARRRASLRVFGSKPGAYGAGLQAPIDEGCWETAGDLAETFLAWSAFGYGRGLDGAASDAELRGRLKAVELVMHNQDNREHDLLDSDDYYQFEGGLIAAVRELSGRQPEAFHNDHSRPDHPRVRRLQEEIGLIVRGRAANPKWIAGVMRHGYKGAFEIAATVDYLFAFAATARVVGDHHFDALFDAYLGDERVRGFIAEHNPAALREIAERFAEAVRRGLWRPSRNSAAGLIEEVRGVATP
jgi:cobaltochelatase CobN